MSTELAPTKQKSHEMNVKYTGGSSDAVYGLGLIGAWVYYIRRADTFQGRLLGFFKGFVWPAFLVYALLEYLEKE